MTSEEIKALRNEPWREALRKNINAKQRSSIERVQMPELSPEYRVTTFTEEVQQGLSAEQARLEAQRCLDCADPSCMKGCPVGINIPNAKNTDHDICLICTFRTWEDLDAYATHPEHVKVAQYIGKCKAARSAVDYEE